MAPDVLPDPRADHFSRPTAEDARPSHVSRQALERDGGNGPLFGG
jgi:hypothetical protein